MSRRRSRRPPRAGATPLLARTTLLLAALAATAPLASRPAAAAPHVPTGGDTELDRQAAHALEHLVAGDVERAAVLARSLARHHPRFALGQLLHAELSSASAFDGTLVGSSAPWSPTLVDLLLEARTRLDAGAPDRGRRRAPAFPLPAALPAPFAQIGPGVDHVVVIDLERSVLALHAVRGGVATAVREHYVSSGTAGFGKRREGDRKTPLGLYRIVGERDDAALPELYGAGALVLDYPNAFDRHLGRTGHGIWLHGVPRARRSRAPRSSEGCVTMSNGHLLALRERLDPATTLVVLAGSSGGGDGRDPRDTHTGNARAPALERYRALFLRWRDERLAGPAAPAGLAALDEDDVTILETTVDGLPGTPDLIVMDVPPLTAGATRLALWWTRASEADGWTLALEEGARGGA